MPRQSEPNQVQVIPWEVTSPPPTQEEAEARLHQEGYESFQWYDVPGSAYPSHRHSRDECLWILKGEISIEIRSRVFTLREGDRIYLPAATPHTAKVPTSKSVTYLVGQRPVLTRK